ncbi:NnrS family protein [Shewanella atlantica]|uniref:NnrS family protein n=2 Tax=Shewanella atlantica TaxID=271099 RepID=A0A3S0I7W3_9GAMM|nr:NnrS family protein [Shewanella atlantica]
MHLIIPDIFTRLLESVMLNIDEPTQPQPQFSLFNLGFRPFFLLGAIFSLIAISIWGGFFFGHIQFSPHGDPIWWHGHEMIFGFVIAIIAGFLLTAVQNWTGQPGVKGKSLIALVLVWLLPRVLLLDKDWVSLEVIMAIDLAFAPLTALFMARSVLKVKQWRNFAFVPILLMLMLVNALSYYGLLTNDSALTQTALHSAILLMVTVVALIGGRVIPFFTERATQWQRSPNIVWLEILTFISLILLILSVLFQHTLVIRISAGIAGIILLMRWSRWGGRHTARVPLLWSLHISYFFIPLGLLLIATGENFSAGLHGITLGGLGGMILAMMARVSLGHTGRKLTPPKIVTLAFALIVLATVCRILAGLMTSYYLPLLEAAIACWVLSFVIFIYHYTPILLKARVDGKPG